MAWNWCKWPCRVGARILRVCQRVADIGMNLLLQLKIIWENWKTLQSKDSWGLRWKQLNKRVPVEATLKKAANSTDLNVRITFRLNWLRFFEGDVRVASQVRKAYHLRPEVSASCVSYTDTTKPPEQSGKRTRRAARGTAHTHTHKYRDATQRLSFRRLRRSGISEVHGIS
jgi:hypothetical protein